MREEFGIILLENKEGIIRIYEADDKEWKLRYYQSMQFVPGEAMDAATIVESLVDFITSDEVAMVSKWKVSARGFSSSVLEQASSALEIDIENLTLLREQELLCKGLFTELW